MHYDIIIIGSGAGGGTLAYALAPTGKRILILERGNYLTREKQNWSSQSVWGELRYRNSGRWRDGRGMQFLPKQHYYVGGNTKFYGAVLFRMRERDFREVRHVDGVSPAWPLDYDAFEPYYTAAEHLYCVHGERKSDPFDPPATSDYPYPPISDEPRIAQLRADLEARGLQPFWLPMGIRIDEASPQTSACIRCDTCDGFPCLVGAKADAHLMCVEPALRYPNVELLTGAYVSRLLTDGQARAVTGVEVRIGDDTEVFSADVVVTAAGAINSAALLLRSACDAAPAGLANSSRQVGRNLMLHNNSSLIAFSKIPNLTSFQKTLGVNDFYFGDGDWEFPLGAMQMLGKSDSVTMAFDAPDADDPADLAAHSLDFWLTTEDLPRAANRVRLGADGGIVIEYEPTNLEAHARLVDKFKGLLSAMQCRDEVREHPHYLGGKLGISGVAHQNGTLRFGDDAATSVLNVNCRTHDLDNLYAVDASFFASSSAVNPTLTIIANALRVADHLKERLS